MLTVLLILPQRSMLSQTFEDPVTIVNEGTFADWFIDMEVNPVDATVDMTYITKPGTKYHLQYLKLFSDGSIWRSADLGEFSSLTPPYSAISEYEGRVFAVGVTEEGQASFFLSEDGGASFLSYPPGRFMNRVDILANQFACHALYVDQDNNLAYGRFDPVNKTWSFPIVFTEQLVLEMKPSISDGGGYLFVVYQGSDSLHYERRSPAIGGPWPASPNLIPNSKLIESDLHLRPQLGPKSATSAAKVYAAWAGYLTQNSCCPDVRTARKLFSDPAWIADHRAWLGDPSAYGFAGNSIGMHTVTWFPVAFDTYRLEYRRWLDGAEIPDERIYIAENCCDLTYAPRIADAGAHELGAYAIYGNYSEPDVPQIEFRREIFAKPAPPAGLYLEVSSSIAYDLDCMNDGTTVAEVNATSDDHLPKSCPVDNSGNLAIVIEGEATFHPLLKWNRNNYTHDVSSYIIWRRIIPESPGTEWHPIDSVSANTTSYLDSRILPFSSSLVEYRVVTKSPSNQYSDFSNTVSIWATPLGKRSSKNLDASVLDFELLQNYPNPFNPATSISFQTPQDGLVTLRVFDVLGTEVATLVNEYRGAGRYSTVFDASHLASGIYVYKLQSGSFSQVKRMILIK